MTGYMGKELWQFKILRTGDRTIERQLDGDRSTTRQIRLNRIEKETG